MLTTPVEFCASAPVNTWTNAWGRVREKVNIFALHCPETKSTCSLAKTATVVKVKLPSPPAVKGMPAGLIIPRKLPALTLMDLPASKPHNSGGIVGDAVIVGDGVIVSDGVILGGTAVVGGGGTVTSSGFGAGVVEMTMGVNVVGITSV